MSAETKEIIMGDAERLGWFEDINKKKAIIGVDYEKV